MPDNQPTGSMALAAPLESGPIARYRLALVMGVAVLAVIAVVGALYLARAFFVPLLIGILASYALGPLVDGLKAWSVPRAAGAALVLAALIGSMAWVAISLEDDAASMIAKLPDAARKVRQHVGEARATGPSSLQKIQEAATELQGAADVAAGEKKSVRPISPVAGSRPPEPNVWVRDYMLAQSALLFTVLAQAPIVLLLTYFLLASGEHFRRKLVQLVGPSLSSKKDAVRILEEIDVQIQRCLFAIVASNALVGLGTWIAFEALGVEHAGAWGAAAGVFHTIPYLGSLAIAIASGVTAYLQFGTALPAFTVAGASLLVAAAIGSLLMTWLQSRLSRINAAVLFIALLFFGWLWGIWGLLLGAPLIAIAKVICDRVDVLKPAGDLLGH